MTRLIYLDNNATTALNPEVFEEMLPFFREQFGNPSSIHWAGLKRLPNTANLSFLDVKSDSLLFNLDLAGIAASSGSACSSGALKTSHVLKAMGVGSSATVGNIRFSLGPGNTEEDVEFLLEILSGIVQRLRDMSMAS
jgi:cysteine sulfinate desulfinase/cysteine desulfurase-like protein